MIVQCGNCQTRFRIADERVTPRGVKVRCSRCGEVFLVRRETGAEPAPATAQRVEADGGPAAPRVAPPEAAAAADARPVDLPSRPVGGVEPAPFGGWAPPPLPPVPPVDLPTRPAAPVEADAFAGWSPPARAPSLDVVPVPSLPGLPGSSFSRAEPSLELDEPRRQEPARSPDGAAGRPVSSGRGAAPSVPRAPAIPQPPRRRERPPTGGPVAVLHVVLGAALLLGLLFVVAAGAGREVPGEGGAARALRVLAGEDAPGPELLPTELHASVRETADGGRVLVVGGAIESRRGNPAAPIVVAAEVVARGGRVLARAEGIAGARRTEDEVDRGLPPPSAPPSVLAAGERVPFLVVIGPPPEGLEGAGVRVTARPGEEAQEPRPDPGITEASR